jgi:hypothetical protein
MTGQSGGDRQGFLGLRASGTLGPFQDADAQSRPVGLIRELMDAMYYREMAPPTGVCEGSLAVRGNRAVSN